MSCPLKFNVHAKQSNLLIKYLFLVKFIFSFSLSCSCISSFIFSFISLYLSKLLFPVYSIGKIKTGSFLYFGLSEPQITSIILLSSSTNLYSNKLLIIESAEAKNFK